MSERLERRPLAGWPVARARAHGRFAIEHDGSAPRPPVCLSAQGGRRRYMETDEMAAFRAHSLVDLALAAGAHFARGHEPDAPRLISRVCDAPRHLKHASARPLADLAVSGASLRSHAACARPRPQRLARALRRVRRPTWARSAPSPRDARERARPVGARAAGGERGRGARARTCTQYCAVSTSLALYLCV